MDKNGQESLQPAGRAVLFFAAFVVTPGLVAPSAIAAENHEVTVERNVAAKMRDGVTLRADVYRPKAEGKSPVLLVRTPYDKQWIGGFGQKAAARRNSWRPSRSRRTWRGFART